MVNLPGPRGPILAVEPTFSGLAEQEHLILLWCLNPECRSKWALLTGSYYAVSGRSGGRCSAHESVMPGEAILTPAGVPGSPGPIPSSPCSCAIHRLAPPFRRNLIFDPDLARFATE